MKKLKMNSQYKFKLINRKIFKLLGDKSSNFEFYYHNNYLKKKPHVL